MTAVAISAVGSAVFLLAFLLVRPVMGWGYKPGFRGIEAEVISGSLVGASRDSLLIRFGPPADLSNSSYTTEHGPVTLEPTQAAWHTGTTHDGSWPIYLILTFDESGRVTRAELSQPDPRLYRIPKGPHG